MHDYGLKLDLWAFSCFPTENKACVLKTKQTSLTKTMVV